MTEHILTLTCVDEPGIVHAVTAGLLDVSGNIIDNAQFTEPDTNTFCMRTSVSAPGVGLRRHSCRGVRSPRRTADPAEGATCRPPHSGPHHGLEARPLSRRPAYRWRNGMLPIDVRLIVSNHPDCQPVAGRYDIPLLHLPVTHETKPQQEAQLKELVRAHDIELVVLARYMQILSDDLCHILAGRAITSTTRSCRGSKDRSPTTRPMLAA